MPRVSREIASQIAIDFLRTRKNSDGIEVSIVEHETEGWMVRGTVPIDMEGHPWVESFKVVVDDKGKIKSTEFRLL